MFCFYWNPLLRKIILLFYIKLRYNLLSKIIFLYTKLRGIQMQSLYLSSVDFHTPTETEKQEIRLLQKRHIYKCWFKRFLIFFAIIGTIIIFQLIARQTMPQLFNDEQTVEKLLIYGVSAFFGINIFSYLQLLFRARVLFNIK